MNSAPPAGCSKHFHHFEPSSVHQLRRVEPCQCERCMSDNFCGCARGWIVPRRKGQPTESSDQSLLGILDVMENGGKFLKKVVPVQHTLYLQVRKGEISVISMIDYVKFRASKQHGVVVVAKSFINAEELFLTNGIIALSRGELQEKKAPGAASSSRIMAAS